MGNAAPEYANFHVAASVFYRREFEAEQASAAEPDNRSRRGVTELSVSYPRDVFEKRSESWMTVFMESTVSSR